MSKANPNHNPLDFLLQAAVALDKNDEDINTPKDDSNNYIDTPNVITNTTTIASRTRSSRKKKKNTPQAKKISASTPYEIQQDTYGDADTLIDTEKGVDFAPKGVYTPLNRRGSRQSGRAPSKLLTALDIEDIDDNNYDDDDDDDELNEDYQYITDAIEPCPDDIAAEVHKRYPKTKDREKAIDLVISRIEHLEDASQTYNNRHNITNMFHSLQGCNGLQNITNVDCFMNSVMQILAHTDAITKYYLNSQFMNDLKDTDTKKNKYGSVAIELHKLLRRMHRGERNVSVKELKCAVDSCTIKFPLQQQQDCHDFLLYLLKALHLSRQKLKSSPTDVVDDRASLVSDLFLGEVCSTLECDVCSEASTSRNPEYGLSLSIPTHAIGKRDALMRCLNHFFTTETLSGDDMINCGESPSTGICNAKRPAKKYLRFDPSPLMILTFKRFECDSDTETTTKINDFLGFPLILDMNSYVSSPDTNNNNLEYELQAVINHNGVSGGGHYYLYLKINGLWYKFDDSKEVTQVDEGIVCYSNKEAYTLVYCRSNDVDTIMNQLNVRPRPVNQASTTNPPRVSNRPKRAAQQKKIPRDVSSQPKKHNITAAKSRPPHRAASIPARQQKKTPSKTNVSASQQKKKRSRSKTTATKSSTAAVSKKQKIAQRKVSSQSKTRSQNGPSPTSKSKRQNKTIEDDKKRDEIENYFALPFPPDMDIEDKRTNTKNNITLAKQYYCREELCTKASRGKGDERELCAGCDKKVREFRRKLEFDNKFQFGDDFDDELADITAHIHDSYSDTYIKSTIRQREEGYVCYICHTNIPGGLQTVIPSDSALVRQCLCVLFNIDDDVNMCFYSPAEDYFGKREREVSAGVSDVPSVKEFFQELALWLFNKFYDKYKKDEDFKIRFNTVLEYLQDPSQLHKLWEGDKFEYQDINCANKSFDMSRQFECLNIIYDQNGCTRSTFTLNGSADYTTQKKKEIAAIDVISKAFKRDVEHHSRVGTNSWVGRDDNVEAFMKWLKLRRDILGQNSRAARGLEDEFNAQVQESIDEIDRKREAATRERQRAGTTHPAVGRERECITNGNSPPDYEVYMNTIIRNELEQQHYQFNQDIENELQQTTFYKLLKDAQNNNQGNQPRDNVTLRIIELAYHNEKNTNPWFGDKFNGIRWKGVCSFTNDEYVNAGSHRPILIGDIYRRLLVRLAEKCMMKGCSIKPSDYKSAKSLYAFHLHHIEEGEKITKMLHSIDDMSEEAKKNCVVFCNGCHNFKEQVNVYSIPLNKLQNQLIYDEGDEHISGRQLVVDFDLVVVVLKLFVMGGSSYGSVTRCTPDILRSIFFDHFRILFDDTVDYDVANMFNNLDGDDHCKQLVNSAILGALKKLSKQCAKPECKMDFPNISSFNSTVIHWDHTEDKEYEGAHLHHKQIVVLLNEVGQYLGATCAFCHGEQPKSCREPRTWE